MRKRITLIVCIALTVVVLFTCIYILNKLEYLSQLSALDNMIGALPLILSLSATSLIITLIWRSHRKTKRKTQTVILTLLVISCIVLFFPSLTGNWYFIAVMENSNSASESPRTTSSNNIDSASPDLSLYDPFTKSSKVATLPDSSTIQINGALPKLDGATALYPVYAAFANATYNEQDYSPSDVICSNTSNAYRRIINGDCDIIFVAGPSVKQKQTAKNAGANLNYTPIGMEAFVFLTGKTNPVKGLTYQQIKNIYSGKTAKWKTLGWENGGNIIAFKRPEGSGSQTGLQNIMGTLPIQKPQPLPDRSLIGTGSMLEQVSVEWNGVQPAIGYSYRYYALSMYPNPDSKLIEVDDIYPSEHTIANGSYPFTGDFYAVTNGAPKGNTKRLIDWIQSNQGQYLIKQTGYVPLETLQFTQ